MDDDAPMYDPAEAAATWTRSTREKPQIYITADKPDPLHAERLSIVSDAGTFVSFENTDNLVLRQIKKVLTDSFIKEGPVCQVMFVERLKGSSG